MRAALFALVLLAPAAARAAEPSGCDKFAWPVAAEQQALLAPGLPAADSGAVLKGEPGKAVTVHLAPFPQAALERPPERAPKDPASFAGFVRIEGVSQPGLYRVSLSDAAWIDAVQGGAFLKTEAFSGVTDCPGIRKSVAFRMSAGPFVLQFSAVRADRISFVLTRAGD